MFRTGEGIGWAEQDPVIFDTTERFFRISYRTSLVSEWIPALDGMAARLDTGARVADVGCGRGAALILLAQAYPRSTYVGFDAHPPSIEVARVRAAEAGVSDRVRFEVAHCHGYPADGYDLISFFDAFHDLGDPVGAAAHAREALAEDGLLMLVEPLAADDLATTLATVPTAALTMRHPPSCARPTRCRSRSGWPWARGQVSRGCGRCWRRPATRTYAGSRRPRFIWCCRLGPATPRSR